MGRKFRELLKDEDYLFTGGVYSPLDAQIAQIAQSVGMKSIYLSGYSMALANGWPDMGFLTMTEVTRIASMVASAVAIREDEGGTPDGEPSRDGARGALPGAREAVHSRKRRPDQGLARIRRQARALTAWSGVV
jgi:isocitrate lyase